MPDIEQLLLDYSLKLLLFGTIILGVVAFISLRTKKLTERWKKISFFSIVVATIIPTLFLGVATVYINSISSSAGPVHWHADFEIWGCGKEINLKDPTGISNKIGTSTLHEHNDKRIHVEGVVVKSENVSLGSFFKVIGGELSAASFRVSTNQGNIVYRNGDTCEAKEIGELQVFVYKTDKDGYYSQEKILNPQGYVLSPQSGVPPGDCIIVEFDKSKLKTDKLCRSYKVAEKTGKLKGEKHGN
jgi:hypothetical protein